jgi:ketosteroid isomerase-like protein
MTTDEAQKAAREVLAANESFYRAFASRDFARMESLWSETAAVTCIHPGWAAVIGRAPVIASWRSILASPESPHVVCSDATAYAHGDSAYVICEERIAGAVLVATNIFVRERGAWKLVHHHAGQILAQAIDEEPVPEQDDRSIN